MNQLSDVPAEGTAATVALTNKLEQDMRQVQESIIACGRSYHAIAARAIQDFLGPYYFRRLVRLAPQRTTQWRFEPSEIAMNPFQRLSSQDPFQGWLLSRSARDRAQPPPGYGGEGDVPTAPAPLPQRYETMEPNPATQVDEPRRTSSDIASQTFVSDSPSPSEDDPGRSRFRPPYGGSRSRPLIPETPLPPFTQVRSPRVPPPPGVPPPPQVLPPHRLLPPSRLPPPRLPPPQLPPPPAYSPLFPWTSADPQHAVLPGPGNDAAIPPGESSSSEGENDSDMVVMIRSFKRLQRQLREINSLPDPQPGDRARAKSVRIRARQLLLLIDEHRLLARHFEEQTHQRTIQRLLRETIEGADGQPIEDHPIFALCETRYNLLADRMWSILKARVDRGVPHTQEFPFRGTTREIVTNPIAVPLPHGPRTVNEGIIAEWVARGRERARRAGGLPSGSSVASSTHSNQPSEHSSSHPDNSDGDDGDDGDDDWESSDNAPGASDHVDSSDPSEDGGAALFEILPATTYDPSAQSDPAT